MLIQGLTLTGITPADRDRAPIHHVCDSNGPLAPYCHDKNLFGTLLQKQRLPVGPPEVSVRRMAVYGESDPETEPPAARR